MKKIFLIACAFVSSIIVAQKDIKSELNYIDNSASRVININSIMAPPGNDLCTGAISLTPNGTCVNGTTVEATDGWQNTVGCQNGNASSNHPDVWYSFVATGSQLTLVSTGSGSWAGNVEITLVEYLSGPACTSQATLVGSDCGASPLTSVFNGLQAGNTYYFTLSNASGGTTGPFSVCPTTANPPVVSGQDCGTAAVLCNNLSFTQGSSTAGFGTQEVSSGNSCFGGGERQSKWYKFTVGCSGTLEFKITPSNYNSSTQSGDDYDWALWNVSAGTCPTTANTTFDAVACNWSGCSGATGMANNPLTSFSSAASTNYQANNPAGPGDCFVDNAAIPIAQQWEPTINVTAGQTYALLIDNYTTSNNGFSFEFGGTAIIGPDAGFSYVATGCNAYNFTKDCQVTNSTFLWTFGDGNTSTSQNPSHTFTSSGVFTVTLEVTDNLGCTKTYSESFTVGFPDVTAGSAQTITCASPTVNVSASSTVSGATFSWAGPSIVSGGATSSATVNASGTYTVTVTNPANACTNTTTVAVTTNTTTPNVNAGSDATLTCAATTVNLTGSSSTGGVTLAWTGPSVVSGATTPTVTVNGAGTYTLTVTNPTNGCTATDQAVVTPDSNIPNANAGPDRTLTCSVTSLTINGSSSTAGVNFSWAGAGITAGGLTATPTVNAAGTYTLTVTNPGNGCTATDQVIVSLNNTAPNVNAGSDAIITCAAPNVTLSGSSSTGGVTYSWAGTGISSGGATATPVINAAGNFTLTVTNPTNGCTSTDVATVTTNTILPNANAGSAQVINCINATVPLTGSSSTAGVSFAWTGPNITAGANNASATAGSAGTYTLTVTNPANGCVNTSTVAVTNNTTAPNVNAGSDATLTCATTTLTLTGSSSTGGATFSWAGPGVISTPTTNTVTVNATGTYTLTVTNPVNGCTATDQAAVNPDSNLPNVNAGSDATLTCTTTSLNLSGSSSTAGVTYAWTGPGITAGAASATATVNAAGTYTLTVTNTSNGCQSTDQAVVTLNNTLPNVSVGTPSSLTCIATSVTIPGSSTTVGATYAWTGTGITSGATTATATVNSAGTFTLTVTNPVNGCVNATSATVSANTTIPNSNAGNPATLTCTVLSVALNGSSTTPNPSYAWSGSGIVSGGTTAAPTVNAAGTFTLTVTDPTNGCTAQSNVVVSMNNTLPNVSAGNDAVIICAAPTIDLNGSSTTVGATYLWTGAGIVSGASTATLTVNAAGTYTLIVTDPSNGCTSTDLADVTLDANIPDADAGATQVLDCNASTVVLTGNSTVLGVDYLWSGASIVSGGTTSSATVDQPGTYTLTVTNSGNGCVNTATVSVTQNLAQPSITPGVDQVINCSVTSVVVTATSSVTGLNYTWSGANVVSGGATASATVDAAGTYTLNVVDPSNGCSNSTTVNVFSNTTIPDVSAGIDTVLTCLNTSISLNGTSTTAGVTYSWSGGNIVSGGTSSNPIIDAAATYSLVVTDPSNGCTNSDDVIVGLNNTAPDASAGNDAVLSCGVPSVILTASSITPSVSYSWSGPGIVSGGNSSSATVNVSGSYTVTITNTTNGCTATDVADVTPDSNLPNVDAGNTQILTCAATSVVLNGSSSTSGVDFLWSGPSIVSGGGTNSATVNSTGTYTLTVTNTSNGCQNTDIVVVSIDTVTPIISAGSTQSLTCLINSVNLAGTSNTIAVNYSWSGPGIVSGGATASPTVNAVGTYTLTVTDQNNLCQSTAQVSVVNNNTLPDVTAAANGSITCSQLTTSASANSTTTNPSFVWAGAGIVSGGTTSSVTVNISGTYTVTVTDPSNGCTSFTTVAVPVDSIIPVITASASVPNITCAQNSSVLSATSSATSGSVNWTGPNGALSGNPVTVSVAGTYTISAVDNNNGCASQQTVVVTGNTVTPTVSISPVADINCGTTQVDLNSTTNAITPSYSWSGPNAFVSSQANTTNSPVAGTYSLTVTDASNGCQGTATIVVTQTPDPVASFTSSGSPGFAPLLVSFDNTSTNSSIYTWTFGDSNSSTATDPSNIYTQGGTYTVTLIASNGSAICNDTITSTVTIYGEATVTVPNIFSPNGDGVNDILTIKSSGYKELTISIFNRWGTLITSFNAIGGSWDANSVSEGTYFYILTGKRIDDKDFESHGAIMIVK